MRIATWNVNSLNARLARVDEWIEYAQPDVLCMQETKLADAAFPGLSLSALGYDSVSHGDGRWNGVAIASRLGVEDVQRGFGMAADDQGCRMVAATCGGVRVHSVYVPNGRSVDSEHYVAKLAWLEELRSYLERTCRPTDPVVVGGDFNVAPDDRDVWDPEAVHGSTHVTEPERDALRALEEWGLVDAFRIHYPQDKLFSWWDYRAGSFHKHLGMRIDLLLLTRHLAERCTYALIDRNARKGQQPSDHAPLFVDIAG
ncbi:MAG: exodeoxyribonuclease III [Acidimicrobiales bacterium]